MADGCYQNQTRKLIVRGLGWCLCVSLWTFALLTIYPVKMGTAVLPPIWHFPSAKSLHLAVYAFLAVYISWLPLRRQRRWLLLAFLALHAAGTEYVQQFVPGRHGRISDVVIDHVGLLLGLSLTWKHWLPRSSRDSYRRSSEPSAVMLARSPSVRG